MTDNDIEIGSVLSGYKIEKVLGRGGMGVVYKGHELSLNRKVAIKVLSHRLCADKEFVERFKREARVIAALNHPNIVNILSYGETGGLYYFAMEYLQGRDLGQILKEKRRLPLEEALSVVSQVAGALSEAGSKGVVHRDLKPSNIMVDDIGRVKVTDFGVAHFQGAENRLTQTGLFLGTPEYASPEQAMGKDLDVRSDIYALGAVLYSMLSGSPPYTGPSPLAVVAKIATEPVVPIRQLHPELPKSVCDLIDKMMARDVNARFQTAQELIHAVNRCMQGVKTDVPPIQGPQGQIFQTVTRMTPQKKSRTGLWGGILGVALAVLLVVWFVEGGLLRKKPVMPEPVPETSVKMSDTPGTPPPAPAVPVREDAAENSTASSPVTAPEAVKSDGSPPIAPSLPQGDEMRAEGVAESRLPPPSLPEPSQVRAQPPDDKDNIAEKPVKSAAAPKQADTASRNKTAKLTPPPKTVTPALPKLPTVFLAISGDDAMAMHVRAYLEEIIRSSGLPVTAAVEIPIRVQEMQMGDTLITWHDIKQFMPPGKAHVVLLARVRKTGAMELNYYGRTQELVTAAFTASAVDLDNGQSIATPAAASAEFTSLNMAEELQGAVDSSAGHMGSAIRQYWQHKIGGSRGSTDRLDG